MKFTQSYWWRAINWIHGLEMGVQDPKSGKSRPNLHDTILKGKSIGFKPPPPPPSQKGELMI
jgi:hypothetical protein